MKTRPYVLSIAGFDPSGGAGLMADVKTFEAYQTLGLSVCSAITVQSDISFETCDWVDFRLLKKQIKCLFERFEIQVVKVGIIQSWMALSRVLSYLKELNPVVKVVLDPVLKASANFDFHREENTKIFDEVLESITVITPNYDEIKMLYKDKTIEQTILHMATRTNVYLKGGHNPEEKGVDNLYLKDGGKIRIEPIHDKVYDKHGTGCVLASALAASLAKGEELEVSAKSAKKYVESFMNSNESLLGYHNI